MPAAAAKPQAPKVYAPNWDKIMEILGTPKQEAVFTNRSLDPSDMDGSWDFQAAQKGLGMRRVAADIGKSTTEIETPTGFVFVCSCGYARRVVDSEQAFTCERPNSSGESGCGVLWNVEVSDSEEVDQKTQSFIKKPIYEERIAPKTNRKYMMPKIKGKLLAEARRETVLARQKAGQPTASQYQPQSFGKNEAQPQTTNPTVKANPPVPYVVPEAPTTPHEDGE